MNPNEIKKVLEDLVEQATDTVTWNMNKYGAEEIRITASNVLAYINQLEAEVERVRAKNREIFQEALEIRENAIKEFAERLLSKAIYIRDEEKANGTIHINDIYKTLEEMSGDEHAGD